MVRSEELKDVSYLDTVRMYKWRGEQWQWRKKEAVVSIHPKTWYEALQGDPSKPHNGQHRRTFATAARTAVMLYVPFKSLDDAVDIREFVEQFGLPPFQHEPYDETAEAQNDLRCVSNSVCSKHQMSFRNGYASFSMAHRLKMIGSTSTPMKTGNPHRTFRGDEKRSGRQQIVSWQIIWSDNLGTFLAIVT